MDPTLTFPAKFPLTLSTQEAKRVLKKLKSKPPVNCNQFALKWGVTALRVFLLGGLFVINGNVTLKSFEPDDLDNIADLIRCVMN